MSARRLSHFAAVACLFVCACASEPPKSSNLMTPTDPGASQKPSAPKGDTDVLVAGGKGYLDFGAVAVGSESQVKMSVRNLGPDTLDLNGIVLRNEMGYTAGPDDVIGDLTVHDVPGGFVQVGDTVILTLVLKPTEVFDFDDRFIGSIGLYANADSGWIRLHADALAPDADWEPHDVVDFGVVREGKSVSRTVTVTNDGELPLSLGPSTLIGEEFDLETPLDATTLLPGQSVSLEVTAVNDGGAVGEAITGSLELVTNDTKAPVIVLQLTGQRAGAGSCELEVGSVDFGGATGGQSVKREVAVRNIGTGACELAGMDVASGASWPLDAAPVGPECPIGGGNVSSADFTALLPDPITILPGGEVAIPVEFHPPHDFAYGRHVLVGSLQVRATDPNLPGAPIVAAPVGLVGDWAPCNLRGVYGRPWLGFPSAVDLGAVPEGCGVVVASPLVQAGPVVSVCLAAHDGCADLVYSAALPPCETGFAPVEGGFPLELAWTANEPVSCTMELETDDPLLERFTIAVSGTVSAVGVATTETWRAPPAGPVDVVLIDAGAVWAGSDDGLTALAAAVDSALDALPLDAARFGVLDAHGLLIGAPKFATEGVQSVSTLLANHSAPSDLALLTRLQDALHEHSVWTTLDPGFACLDDGDCPGPLRCQEGGAAVEDRFCQGPNAGMFRANGTLRVIVATTGDLPDEPGLQETLLDLVRGGVIFDVLSGGVDGCGTGDFSPAPRLAALSQASGGVAVTPCGSVVEAAESLAAAISLPRSVHRLRWAAKPGSVSVSLDGEACTDGVTLGADGRTVRLGPGCVPAADSETAITYLPGCGS